MLVLSRRENETICIGDNIYVTVVRIGPDKVRIGIEAPREVRVKRAELPDFPEESTGDKNPVAVP